MINKSNTISSFLIPVSIGELADKITILQIKKEKMNGKKLENIEKELYLLENIYKSGNLSVDLDLFSSLKQVNFKLWNIEDQIRIKEERQEFDNEFIQLARSVYKQNDARALIKRNINNQYNSDLIEEKLYKSSRI